MLERVISIIIGYVCGLMQTSYLYGRLKHIDIREYGSGNAGTTNALRTLGKKAGLITFLGDFLKPMIAALLAGLIFRDHEQVKLFEIYAGVGAVLGHIFPCYLGFKGGKGVATIAGMSSLFCFRNGCWFVVPVMMLVFIAVVVLTRYVSLGSIIIIVVYFLWIIYLGQDGVIKMDSKELYEIYILTGLYSLVAVYKHRANILRLVRGEENKIFQKKE
ncbi:MAG: glycerol-3-phosphate 1-O-acyltransferase PlsY [Lachnospiraceae bacterium]|nr:glycerol-3-phosphate 1-O-acyltransferase PlsY [Lachnospiraceae bacterium]